MKLLLQRPDRVLLVNLLPDVDDLVVVVEDLHFLRLRNDHLALVREAAVEELCFLLRVHVDRTAALFELLPRGLQLLLLVPAPERKVLPLNGRGLLIFAVVLLLELELHVLELGRLNQRRLRRRRARFDFRLFFLHI